MMFLNVGILVLLFFEVGIWIGKMFLFLNFCCFDKCFFRFLKGELIWRNKLVVIVFIVMVIEKLGF